jgi:hypothetical protein
MKDQHVYRHLTTDQARLLDSLTAPQAEILERLWHGDSAPVPGSAAELERLRAEGLIQPGGYPGRPGPHPAWGLTAPGLTLLTNLRRQIEDEKRFASKP